LFKLATYVAADRSHRAGLLTDDVLIDAEEATGHAAYRDVLGILNDWAPASEALAAAAGAERRGTPLRDVEFAAPVLYPSGVYCAGANYTDHLAEMTERFGLVPEPEPHSVGLLPWHFVKPVRTIVAHGASVRLPARSQQVDWEIELVAVIGREAKGVSIADALSYVAGYTVANDLSARDLTFRHPLDRSSPFFYDWVSQKCFDGSCPLGPWIVPASDVGNVQHLGLKLWVNGALKQDSNTSLMVFSVAEQIAKLSESMTLYPGDLILTGTPAGVGAARNEYLHSGDRVTSWIENIGTLEFVIA
jgi:2-keto-4-pentenoate hydratase/2-oxohepta-3-ene-1,7-dioic acid hydratase in catechol pathway